MQMKKLILRLFLLIALSQLIGCQSERFYTDRHTSHHLTLTDEKDSFTFAIFGDRTGGKPEGLIVLKHAVIDVNVLAPDLVMTVGDLVQGYNERSQWQVEADEFSSIMNKLDMPWYPVAGNHDIYWRGENRPEDEHEGDYEKHFGPLWYAFEHKDCLFLVLYSDEGNPETGQRTTNDPEAQKMSKEQKDWLKSTLSKAGDTKHIFVFLHHPRWDKGNYGDDWDQVHTILKDAGNVSAVFGGHKHKMNYGGEKDGIHYYTLGTTGASHGALNIPNGRWQHFDMVTVRGKEFSVGAIGVGEVVDTNKNRVKTLSLLARTKWNIKSEDTRTLSWPLTIPHFHEPEEATLSVKFRGGDDNSGDKGFYMQINDLSGKTLEQSFSKTNKFNELRLPVKAGERYVFKIIDDDTSFSGKQPGNNGRVEINLELKKPKYPTESVKEGR